MAIQEALEASLQDKNFRLSTHHCTHWQQEHGTDLQQEEKSSLERASISDRPPIPPTHHCRVQPAIL